MALTDISHPTDIAMLTDLYELTMAQGLWESGKANEQGCFTAFYRDHPFGSAYAVMCGTAELPELVENLRFTPEDIDYLASLQAPAGGAMFKPGFLDYLRDFRAHVNIDAVPEGELVFPREPMVRVTGPALECQLLETALLNIVAPELCLKYMLAHSIDQLLSNIIYLIYPTTFERPVPPKKGLTGFVIGTVYGANHRFLNCAPSVHCSVSFLFAFATLAAPMLPLWLRLVIVVWSLAIVASTMLVKQHMVIDAVTALPAAAVCWLLAGLVNFSSLAAKFS